MRDPTFRVKGNQARRPETANRAIQTNSKGERRERHAERLAPEVQPGASPGTTDRRLGRRTHPSTADRLRVRSTSDPADTTPRRRRRQRKAHPAATQPAQATEPSATHPPTTEGAAMTGHADHGPHCHCSRCHLAHVDAIVHDLTDDDRRDDTDQLVAAMAGLTPDARRRLASAWARRKSTRTDTPAETT
jgi:hypothetical protein